MCWWHFVDVNIYYCCCCRQCVGYSGRTNKTADSCYCYWVGASLNLLGAEDFQESNISSTRDFLLAGCQCCPPFGNSGFSKEPNSFPDLLHTFYSLGYLSLSDISIAQSSSSVFAGECGTVSSSKLNPIDVRFGMCTNKLPKHAR